MLRCTSCKKTQPESEFKKFNETLSKTCIQCLSKRKKKHVIRKFSQTQLGENSSEYQNIQTNTTSAIDNPTDDIEDTREVHIDELSQLVSELVDANHLSEFELDVTFDTRKERAQSLKFLKKFETNLQKEMDTSGSKLCKLLRRYL